MLDLHIKKVCVAVTKIKMAVGADRRGIAVLFFATATGPINTPKTFNVVGIITSDNVTK